MKSYLDANLQREQALYLETLLPPRDELLAEMETYSAAHNIPSSDPEVALFLAITAQAINTKRALEIGTAIGYGAITLAHAMGEGSLVTTIDPNALPRLGGSFDLAYIDAVKEEYCDKCAV